MSHDRLRSAIDSIRTQLQAELDAQLVTVERHQQEAIEAARRAADVDAHERWSVKLEQIRVEWASRLETELAAAAADADRRTVAEATRARLETEQAAAESIAEIRQQAAVDADRARAEFDKALADERDRAERALAQARARVEEVEGERDRESRRAESLEGDLSRLLAGIERERNEHSAALAAERARRQQDEEALRNARTALEEERRLASEAEAAAPDPKVITEVRVEERQAQLAIVERLLDSIHAIGSVQSLSDVLTTLVAGAAGEVPRAAILIVNGRHLEGFKFSGFDESVAAVRLPLTGDGALQEAVATGAPVSLTAPRAPGFAHLPPDRAGLAVPIRLGGQTVAVLYADDVSPGEPAAPASWPEAVQILCRHASTTLAFLTAVRTGQAVGLARKKSMQKGTPGADNGEQAARRYARLLVSEIKLYNETAVRVGREKRDLLTRLRPEVARARRLYEERVSPDVSARDAYFQQELVQTLADGDSTLLGSRGTAS